MPWSSEWPTEPGWYWFYGVTSNYFKEPQLYVAEARRGGNRMFYVCRGGFLYAAEGAEGQWRRIDEPELPR